MQHQFKDATLYVWVDNKLALTRPLHGAMQKKLVVFSGTRGVDSETLKIPAGKHDAARKGALGRPDDRSLAERFRRSSSAAASKSLQVTFDKHNTAMRLAWQ